MSTPDYLNLVQAHPGLATEDIEEQDRISSDLAQAWLLLLPEVWKEQRWRAAILQAAHQSALRRDLVGVSAPDPVAAPEVSSQSVGAWSMGFVRAPRSPSQRLVRAAQVAPGSDAWWGLTRWGMEFLQVRGDVLLSVQFDGII